MRSLPTIQGFRVRAVRVPMTEPHQTSSGVITESPLVLTDILTDAGIHGHSIVFTYTPTAHWLEYADWWNPILAEPLLVENGMAIISDTLGTGVEWNEDAVTQFSA